MMPTRLKSLVLIGLILLPATAWAHREDYADETLVFLTLHRHEVEPEYWLDRGRDGNVDFSRHSLALEYGFTDHWMAESRMSWIKADGGALALESGRLETRYRFGEEGALPVDVAASGEVNRERSLDREFEWGVEPRLILSKDFRGMNATVNLAEEMTLRSHEKSFNPSLGMRIDPSSLFRLAAEVRYFSAERGGAVVPQVAFNIGRDLTLKVAFSYGIGRRRHSNFARLAGEAGFGDED